MTHRLLFGILLVSVSTACALTVTAAPSTPADTSQLLEVIRKKHDLPALAVVVVKDGRICDRAAVGVRKWGETTPVTTNDVFHIGSCTKSMTATLTAMLIEDGKLRWDTTIADVFPELKGKMDKQYETVTVEQLLTHRGGVPGAPPAAAWKRDGNKRAPPPSSAASSLKLSSARRRKPRLARRRSIQTRAMPSSAPCSNDLLAHPGKP